MGTSCEVVLSEGGKRILLNRSDALGDNILTMPMLEAIKEDDPKAHVAVIISALSVDLYLNHPNIDKIFVYHRKAYFFTRFLQLWRAFREFSPNHYLFVGGDHLASFVAFLRRVPFRGGLVSRWPSFLFLNKGVRQRRSVVAMHESEYNLELLRPLGIEYHYTQRHKFRPQVRLDEDEKRKAYDEFLSELQNQGKKTDAEMIFIHPGMNGHTLNWSSRNYGRFILRLERHFPGRFLFVISYTPSDTSYLEGLKDHFSQMSSHVPDERVVFFNGAVHGLRHYMCVLSQAQLFVGPSTGTTHIANTLGVKTIALYSPIRVQSNLRWGPFDDRPSHLKVLVPDVVCGQTKYCAGQSCPYYECMAKIEVEDVIKTVQQLME